MENLTSYLSVLIFLFVMYAFYHVWFGIPKPPIVPFWLYKNLCQLGKKADFNTKYDQLKGLVKFQIEDIRYREWLDEIKVKGHITQSEYMALEYKIITEINNELRRRGIEPDQ